jgi:hypothetical protein
MQIENCSFPNIGVLSPIIYIENTIFQIKNITKLTLSFIQNSVISNLCLGDFNYVTCLFTIFSCVNLLT